MRLSSTYLLFISTDRRPRTPEPHPVKVIALYYCFEYVTGIISVEMLYYGFEYVTGIISVEMLYYGFEYVTGIIKYINVQLLFHVRYFYLKYVSSI